MIRRAASRFASAHGFGSVLLAVPVRWEVYSIVLAAIFPLIGGLALWAGSRAPDPMLGVVSCVVLVLLGAILIPLQRIRGIVVCEDGLLVGNFGPGKDIAAARWSQIELDSLRGYTNVKRVFFRKTSRLQLAPQIGTEAESHGVAFVGPAMAAARPQGLRWLDKVRVEGALAQEEFADLEWAKSTQIWAAAMRAADLPPFAHAVATALDAAEIPGSNRVVDQIVNPTQLPRPLPDAARHVYESALDDGLLMGQPLTDQALQSLLMFQAIAMRPRRGQK